MDCVTELEIKMRKTIKSLGRRDMRLHAVIFFFSSRRRHTRCSRDWSSDVCSSDLSAIEELLAQHDGALRFLGQQFFDGGVRRERAGGVVRRANVEKAGVGRGCKQDRKSVV